MIPRDKKDKAVRPGDVVHMIGRVERVSREGVAVKVRDGLSVYVPPDAVEVIAE